MTSADASSSPPPGGSALARSAFRPRGFRYFWIARFLATFATQVVSVAVGWQVYDLTRNPFDLGLVGLVQFAPALVLVLVTGHVADRFNRVMLEEMRVDQYFTMAYAEVDLASGAVQLVQAGHPHPMILRRDGQVEALGDGGLPIGLIDGARYDRVEARLLPGDRLFLISDGVTECPDADGVELGAEGLTTMLQRNGDLASPALLEALIWDLTAWYGRPDFADDVSGIVFDYLGPDKPANAGNR